MLPFHDRRREETCRGIARNVEWRPRGESSVLSFRLEELAGARQEAADARRETDALREELAETRERTEGLEEENAELRDRLDTYERQPEEIGDRLEALEDVAGFEGESERETDAASDQQPGEGTDRPGE